MMISMSSHQGLTAPPHFTRGADYSSANSDVHNDRSSEKQHNKAEVEEQLQFVLRNLVEVFHSTRYKHASFHNSILKTCATCEGKGAIDCKGCKGTGRNKKNGNIFERWKCFECQGFGMKGCPTPLPVGKEVLHQNKEEKDRKL